MGERKGRRWRAGGELLLVLAILAVATSMFAPASAKQAGDEANWLGTARFFLVLFVRHDISAESWPDSYWTRTQPMIPRYVMGGWLWARGIDYEWLDPNYDHRRKWFSNVDDGKAPTEQILTEARTPMRGLAIVSAALLYGVVRVLAGPLGGLAAALLFCGSPYLTLHLVRAMGEPPFVFFLLATMLVSLLAIKRGGGRGPSVGLGVLAGILLGLAFASKLTAIIAIVGLVLWGVWVSIGTRTANSLLARWRPSWRVEVGGGWHSLIWSLGVLLVALVVFVASNPFLYRDPVGRTWLLFQNRQTEMASQATIDPSRAVPSLTERARLVWRNSLVEDTWAESHLRVPIEAVLAVVGLAWLTARATRHGAEMFLMLWVLGFFGGVTLGLGYVLDHYFVPTAVMGLILSGLTVGWSARVARSLGARLSRQRGHHVGQGDPALA